MNRQDAKNAKLSAGDRVAFFPFNFQLLTFNSLLRAFAPLRLCVMSWLFLLLYTTVVAQTDCPASVLLALARAAAACSGIERNQACYGNGSVSATFQPGVSDAVFEQPGHIVNIGAIEHLSIGGASDYSVATLQVQADLSDREQRSLTILLFGSAEIANQVPSLPQVPITSTGTLNIRTLPQADADILATLPLRGTATANGRTQDNRWLRVMTPNNILGWASVENLTAEGDPSTLSIVDATTPFRRPFQVLTITTGSDDALCDGTSESGALIQSPNNTTPVELTVNGALLRLAGTAFLQANDVMTISVLDGYAEVETLGAIQYVPAGAHLSPESAAQPYDAAELQFLPINNLPHRFAIPQPLTQDEIDAATAAWAAPEPAPVPTISPQEDDRCRRVTRRNDSLSAGPGTFYEVVNEIGVGTSVDPVFQVTDAAGQEWWQLRGGNWIPASGVISTGNCAEVPVTNFVPAPTYNELSLETCETTNGPLRQGQYVEITFVPPAWHTYEDAYIAPQVDPGQITVDSQSLYVYADEVIEIAADRYIRVFEADWEATAGSHRIVGERLHYIITCNLTVPVG